MSLDKVCIKKSKGGKYGISVNSAFNFVVEIAVEKLANVKPIVPATIGKNIEIHVSLFIPSAICHCVEMTHSKL